MDTVDAFRIVQTQWRYAEGVITGLDYAGCKVALEAASVDIRRVFAGLQVMEMGVLSALADQRG